MKALVVLIIIGFSVYLYLKNKNKPEGKKGGNAYEEGEIPILDRVFKRDLNQPDVPIVINSYRKFLVGKSYAKINDQWSKVEFIEDDFERNMAYIQFVEPMLDLLNADMFEFFRVEHILLDVYRDLMEYLPIIGARGQLKNLEDISNFFPKTPVDSFDNEAYRELDARNEILKIIKEKGVLYNKDLKSIESYNNLKLKDFFMNRMISYGVIKMEKKGRFIVYTN